MARMASPQGFEDKVAFVWKVADTLRGTFRQHEYGQVMLPLLVLRRMDAVLVDTKPAVLAKAKTFETIAAPQAMMLKKVAGQRFYNISRFTFTSLLSDDKALAENPGDHDAKLALAQVHLLQRVSAMDGSLTMMDMSSSV